MTLRDDCPSCGEYWSKEDPSGRVSKIWPMVGGNVVNDRVSAWTCLHCGTSWPRGSAEIEA